MQCLLFIYLLISFHLIEIGHFYRFFQTFFRFSNRVSAKLVWMNWMEWRVPTNTVIGSKVQIHLTYRHHRH